jgi:hypothetical protein
MHNIILIFFPLPNLNYSPLVQKIIEESEASSNVGTDIMEEAKREAKSMEITECLSQEMKKVKGMEVKLHT